MKIILLIALFILATPAHAEEVAYRTGGKAFADAWHHFYDLGDHEPELDDPLIKRGKAMGKEDW